MAAVGLAVLGGSLCVWICHPRNPGLSTLEAPLDSEMAFVDRAEPEAFAYPLPEKPVRNQATAPCSTKTGEVEINKGCWVALEKKPPCFGNQAEYQGKCYLPVRKPEALPQSASP
jgi:hypothetical protein